MNRPLRFALFGLIALAVLVGAVVLAAQWFSARKSARHIEVALPAVALPDDDASLARGKYLFDAIGCLGCHGANGAGRVVIDDPNGLYVRSPNITQGAGGVVGRYQPADWLRVIRHGIKPAGTPVFVMPSEDYNRLSAADLGALIAYARSLPPAPGLPAEIRRPLLVNVLYAFGVVRDAAEKIDHSLPPPAPVASGPTALHGAYMANGCIGCHRPGFVGGKIPGAPPSWPAAANLTPAPGSALQRYPSAAEFKAMIRTGKRPDGSAVSSVMPFESLRNYSDTDLEAMYVYFRSLPPLAASP